MSSGIKKILCADDEPANLKLLEAVLVPRGYEVVKVQNGREALDQIGKLNIDLALLDVMMPEMNGFEVCRAIKSDERYRNIPVVMITALTSKKDRIKGIEAGAEDFISKPFDQAEVVARIKMLLWMKELNDRLNSAYANINNLVSFGESIVKAFDPFSFEFMPKIDSIVGQIIRSAPETRDKPRVIVVGVFDERLSTWKWYHYEYAFTGLSRQELHRDIQHTVMLPERGKSATLICNASDTMKPDMQPFVKIAGSLNIDATNMVLHLTHDFCIIAMNYGRDITSHDAAVLDSLVMQALFLKSLSGQLKETEDAFEYTVHALARASELNDEDTGNHILRVGEYSSLIARNLGMPEAFVRTIRIQAQMHDVGKIHTPPDILKKPGRLTPDEWEEIKKHTLYGKKIIGEHLRFGMAGNIALTHHERWDGTGYPQGLVSDRIPLEGRIVTIADQYDALRNERVYKPSFDHKTVYRIIVEGDGRTMPYHFDPRVLQAFKVMAGQFEETYARLTG
jgi:response regulator RpfG family c-di-GMP phosphodiesterase